jgi:hypothetical protein
MSRIEGCNDRQSSFLRSFVTSPSGPHPKDWPSPAILRRWLRKPRFRAAFDSIQSALRLQEGFLLTSASNSALRALDVAASSPDLIRHTLSLLRLSHLRHRFDATDRNTPPPTPPAPKKPETPQPKPQPPLYIRPQDGLTDEEFQKLAAQRNWSPPLRECPDFPPPLPQDTFYYQLLQSLMALLWWLKLYDQQSPDHRFQPILMSCKHLLPNQRPDLRLPVIAPPPA